MIAIALLLLALAAGTYLLIKVTREYLGGLFKFLAWLIIVLSLLSIVGIAIHGARHFHHMRQMRYGMDGRGHGREERIMIREFGDGHSCMDSSMGMSCCKMQGDSMVMDRGVCEKMIGKEACDKMCRERGQCIMSKEECAKMCGGKASCCMPAVKGETKECFKKK